MNVEYVTRRELDAALWDQALTVADNGPVYARSSYLDMLTDQWDALIMDNYRLIMPLPFRIKWGVRYLYQPAFIQQLGIIGQANTTETGMFIANAKQHFKYADINLNFKNEIEGQPCSNFILDLSRPYADINSSYNYYLRRSTKEDRTTELLYKPSAAFEPTIDLYRRMYGSRFPHVKEKSYRSLLSFAEKNPDSVINRVAWWKDEMVSSVLLLKDQRRIYLLVSVTTERGQQMEANRFLMDQLIREFAGSSLILDFEGSDLPGVAA